MSKGQNKERKENLCLQYPLFNVVRRPELGLYQSNSKSANRLFHVLTLTYMYSSPYKWLINDRSRLGSKVQGVGCICVKSAFGRNVGNHTCVSCATEGVLKIGKKDRKKKDKMSHEQLAIKRSKLS